MRPEGMHLTLYFFGDVPVGQLPAVKAACADALAGFQHTFSLRLAGLGAFPNCAEPRVLWAGVAGDFSLLHDVQADAERILNARGYHPRDAAFSPHITIGRLRETLPAEERAAAGAAYDALSEAAIRPFADVPPMVVEGATLYSSTRQAGGSAYEALARFRFGGEGPIE